MEDSEPIPVRLVALKTVLSSSQEWRRCGPHLGQRLLVSPSACLISFLAIPAISVRRVLGGLQSLPVLLAVPQQSRRSRQEIGNL
jgi:hypothetical protein